MVSTGEFTGRSPQDRFVVEDDSTKDTVDWGDINIPISAENFDQLHNEICDYLAGKDVYARECLRLR